MSPGGTLAARLAAVWREMNETDLPFDEWVMLESIARRIERRLAQDGHGSKPTQEAASEGTQVSREERKIMTLQQAPSSERSPVQLETATTADLVREAFDEAKELVRTEVELAKEEMKAELKHAERAAIGFGIAAAAAFIVLSLLAVAIVLAFGGTPVAALLVAACFLVLGGVAAYVGYALLPKQPLERTRHRLRADVNQLKEHIA